MTSRRARLLCLGGLALGAFLSLSYFVLQWLEPHGPSEFAYSPFTVEPLPYSPMRGFTYEQLWGHVRRVCLLGPGLGLLIWALSREVTLKAPRDLRRVMLICSGACLLLTAVLMLGVLRGRALITDELVYATQAGFYKAGRLAGIDLGVSPHDPFTVPTRLGYTGKYLPGEALLQIPGVAVGIPALLHLPVVAVTLWAFYRALRQSSGERIAQLATAALACSPMVAFTSATGLSHAAALMWVALMGWGVSLAREGRTLGASALSAVSLILGLSTRPQSMLPIGAVLGLALAGVLLQKRAWLAVGLFALIAGAGLGLLLGYNQLLTGSPWRVPWFLQCNAEHYGFGRVWQLHRYEHTPLRALENLAVVAVRLNAWLLGLPLSLAVLVAWWKWCRQLAGAGLWLWVGAAVVVFEFFYYSPGVSETGTVYHYELLLPGALLTGIVVDTLLVRFAWAPLALTLGLVLGTGSWVIEQGLRVHRLVTLIHRESDAALAKVSAPAVLIYEFKPSETVTRGWVSDGFPRRFRERDAPIVTLPRVSSDMPALAARLYPGRACWYFHYRPGQSTAELLKCQDASELLNRPVVGNAEEPAPYWERPTAYRKADYEPFASVAASREVDAEGHRRMACCDVRGMRELGATVPEGLLRSCLETGEP